MPVFIVLEPRRPSVDAYVKVMRERRDGSDERVLAIDRTGRNCVYKTGSFVGSTVSGLQSDRGDHATHPSLKSEDSTHRTTATRSGHVRELIEESIATGRFPPGMRLDETMLAERFDVSRTPLREALFQLASVGLVEMKPRRGSVVAEITPHQLVEMFEVMGELEGMCSRLASRRMSQLEQERLVDSLRACEGAREAMDPDWYYYENQKFHHLIYAGSHNGFLRDQAVALHRRLSPYRRLQLRVRDRVPRSFSEHQGIVSAIISGQSDLAAQLARAHIIVQGQRFADLIASLAGLHDGNAWKRALASSTKERGASSKKLAKPRRRLT